jgi:hypothetical protein
MSDPFYKREPQARPNDTKAFSLDKTGAEVVGRSNEILYSSYNDYAHAEYLSTSCHKYAEAFTKTMLDRA